MKNKTSFQHNRITLTTISGSGILIPLKNGFLEKISTCRGKRSPAVATRRNTYVHPWLLFYTQFFAHIPQVPNNPPGKHLTVVGAVFLQALCQLCHQANSITGSTVGPVSYTHLTLPTIYSV